jgi:hypothetical protein
MLNICHLSEIQQLLADFSLFDEGQTLLLKVLLYNLENLRFSRKYHVKG